MENAYGFSPARPLHFFYITVGTSQKLQSTHDAEKNVFTFSHIFFVLFRKLPCLPKRSIGEGWW